MLTGSLLPALLPAQELEPDRSWKPIVLKEAACEISSPGPFTEKVDTVETTIGNIVYHTFFYQTSGDGPQNYFYMLSYCDYPENAVHSDSTALIYDFFETTIQAATSSVDGNLIFTNEIEVDNYPGRFWRINYLDDQVVIRTKAYVVKNRYYAIQTIMHKERSLNPASDWFLNSFRLL